LVYKKFPTTLSERISFVTSWIYRENSWPIWVSRTDLAEILQVIKGILDNRTQLVEYHQLEQQLPSRNDF
jgi:hypothetical protein